ncbi:MAG: hypothetical protein EPO27_09515, partial [Betaproteobacteria bacterium]
MRSIVRWRTDRSSGKVQALTLIAETMPAFLTWRPSMMPVALKMRCAFALVIGAVLAAGPVLAEKPSWAGSGKGGKGQRDEQKGGRRDGDRASAAQRRHFEDQHRVAVRQYFGEHYGEQFRGSRCPPGLAKKHNGCMPPGQAKKW